MTESNGTRSGVKSDRITAGLLISAALLIAFESRTFTVGFVTDPLGPKAFPLVSAFLLLVGGVALLFRPGVETKWPRGYQLLRVATGVLCLFAYALLLGVLGFFTTTMLLIAVFSLQLGGRPIPALLSAAGISGALYALFVYALDIVLPLGSLFVLGG